MQESPLPKLSEIKAKIRTQFNEARLATESPDGEKGYSVLDNGIDAFSKTLFGSRSNFTHHIEDVAKRRNGAPVRIMDYGCGAGQFAREVVRELGDKFPLEIVEVSAGDPRTQEEKEIDIQNNILFIDQMKPAFVPSGKFDLIVSMTTFVHLADPLRTLKILYTALVEHGEIRISYGIDSLVGSFYDGEDEEAARRQVDQLIAHLNGTGVGVEVLPHGMIFKKGPPRLDLKGLHYAKNSDALSGNAQYNFEPE